MADIVYTVNQDSPENITGFEQFSQEDKALVSSFQINSTFNPNKDYSELHILSLSDELLESDYNYIGFTQLGNAQSAGQEGASVLTIDPLQDAIRYGYQNGGVKLLYHFLSDLYTKDKTVAEFYIQDISADRTELSLATKLITPEDLVSITSAIKSNLQSQSYFTGFRLNFKNNDLFIATNIDTLDSSAGKVVVVKLYEPLPDTYGIKSILNIVDIVSDSTAYEVDSELVTPPVTYPTLRSPNFSIDSADLSVIPTNYYNYNELLSYPVNNSNSQIYSAIGELGAEISIDHSDFSNFVHFSSAQERLLNFKYKLDLLTNYSASLSSIASSTTGLQGVSGSREYYQNLTTGILTNFDHYERFLYYESGSSSWPKSNTAKPYINKPSTNTEALNWYTDQIANAVEYDQTNYNSLLYSIPTFLRDDTNNQNYVTFVYMVGQHFDNLWLYSKAVTDKYDADNRPDYGISKDLVGEALKNFGVKLYTSNKSVEDLFTTFIGQAYQSGSEVINNYITGSLTGSGTPIQPTSYDSYQKEVQKRIYHNLPLLIKSKGTERGLRALISCLGISSDILKIKVYGGRNSNERPFYGDYRYYSSSSDKIRLDNTGSIISGSTLSQYTSIIKRDDKYTDDLHPIEVGFSPIDNVDNYIISKSLSTGSLSNFNIDDYIGDPRNLTLDQYYLYDVANSSSQSLSDLTNQIMSGSTAYNIQDYVRLIKFYDNTIFKMVKDFIPARAVADTGIIIKPHILSRSKAKSVILSATEPDHSGSIDTAFTTGSDSGWIRQDFITSYIDIIQTPLGAVANFKDHTHEEPRFNGEFDGGNTTISTGNLTSNNPYTHYLFPSEYYNINLYSTPPADICVLQSSTTPYILTQDPQTLTLSSDIFGGIANSATQYTIGTTSITPSQTYTFTGIAQYATVGITGSQPAVPGGCAASASAIYVQCALAYNAATAPVVVSPENIYNITSWFTGTSINTSYEYCIVRAGVSTVLTSNLTAVNFSTHPEIIPALVEGEQFTIIIRDLYNPIGCIASTSTINYNGCTLASVPVNAIPGSARNNITNWFTGDGAATEYYFQLYTDKWNVLWPESQNHPYRPGIVLLAEDPTANPTNWVRIYDAVYPNVGDFVQSQPTLYTVWNFPTDSPLTLMSDPNYPTVPPFSYKANIESVCQPYGGYGPQINLQYITHIKFRAVNNSLCTAETGIIAINQPAPVVGLPVTFFTIPATGGQQGDEQAGCLLSLSGVDSNGNPLQHETVTLYVIQGNGQNYPYNPNAMDVLNYQIPVYSDPQCTILVPFVNPVVLYVAPTGQQVSPPLNPGSPQTNYWGYIGDALNPGIIYANQCP